MLRDNNRFQTHIRSCYKTPGGKTKHSLWGPTCPKFQPSDSICSPKLCHRFFQLHKLMWCIRTCACIWITHTASCWIYASEKPAEDNLQETHHPIPAASHTDSHRAGKPWEKAAQNTFCLWAFGYSHLFLELELWPSQISRWEAKENVWK